jgi:putative heme-binding domain-containing protein
MQGPSNSTLRRFALAGVFLLAAAPVFGQGGDPAKGKELVNVNGCLGCHRIGDTGSRVGPNLTDVGGRRTPDRLQTSILKPDDEVLPENRYVSVSLNDGTTVRGRLINRDGISVQLMDSKEQLRSFIIKDIKGFTILTKGLMPSFEGKLTVQQVSDMVAYLSFLKGSE